MRLASDLEGVSPTIATLLLVAIVVTLGATVFVLADQFRDRSTEPAPHVALVTDNAASTGSQWALSFHSAMPPRPTEQFVLILRTPANGTLVAKPTPPLDDQIEFYWPLDDASGTGSHDAPAATPGTAMGGFHLRLSDIGGDGRIGGGDSMRWWYDGDGDQAHASGADDPFPQGAYTLEVKHQRSDKYVALELRHF